MPLLQDCRAHPEGPRMPLLQDCLAHPRGSRHALITRLPGSPRGSRHALITRLPGSPRGSPHALITRLPGSPRGPRMPLLQNLVFSGFSASCKVVLFHEARSLPYGFAVTFGGSMTYSSPVRARICARRSVSSLSSLCQLDEFLLLFRRHLRAVPASALFSSSSCACTCGISRSISTG